MKDIYAIIDESELRRYKAFAERFRPRLEGFLELLKAQFQTQDLPEYIVWTNQETATTLYSHIPLPAYTNEYRIVICPDLEAWQRIYLTQSIEPDIQSYYQFRLSENHVLQILGHEFVHHSDLFLDEVYEREMWFEEGMCEYISRKFFLTEQEFDEEAYINAQLVASCKCDGLSNNFSSKTYAGTYSSIFFEYWHSFLSVKKIIDRYQGDIMAVFSEYHRWASSPTTLTLTQWFHL